MISEFSVKAKPSNNRAKIAFAVLVSLAGIVFCAYVLMSRYSVPKYGLVGLLALVLITTAVYLYTRYVGVVYYYDITFDSYKTPVFVVRQVTGKRESTLCRINIADIYKATRESRSEAAKHKTPYTYKKYSYVPSFLADSTVRLVTMGRYEKAEIVLEISDEYANMLLSYAKEARDARILADDDY